MKKNDIKTELSKKLADVNSRIITLKDRHDELVEESATLQEIIGKLEIIRDNILVQFDEIEGLQESDSHRMPELERNIYGSFSSFEEAFSKAGSLTKSSKFGQREHRVNFKNPLDTK